MKLRTIIVLICAFTLVFAINAFAAGAGKEKAGMEGKGILQQSKIKASNLMGKQLTTKDGEKLGKVTDVIIDRGTSNIAFVLVDASEIEGMRGKQIAVPFKALSPGTEADTLMVNADKAKLRNAPSLAKEQIPQAIDRQFETEVYRFYGVEPYWEGMQPGMEPGMQPGMEPKTKERGY